MGCPLPHALPSTPHSHGHCRHPYTREAKASSLRCSGTRGEAQPVRPKGTQEGPQTRWVSFWSLSDRQETVWREAKGWADF